jgi:hypothetical protein
MCASRSEQEVWFEELEVEVSRTGYILVNAGHVRGDEPTTPLPLLDVTGTSQDQ